MSEYEIDTEADIVTAALGDEWDVYGSVSKRVKKTTQAENALLCNTGGGSKYATAALQTAAIVAANMAGAKVVAFENTGTTPGTLTTDTAAAIVAAIASAQVGDGYMLYIRNSSGSANTATIAGGTGVTMHGTLTIAQSVTRTFVVVLTSLTAVDIYSMGISAAGA